MGKSCGMQRLFLRKCLVSCFHLATRKKPWELASWLLIVSQFSEDRKRDEKDGQGGQSTRVSRG